MDYLFAPGDKEADDSQLLRVAGVRPVALGRMGAGDPQGERGREQRQVRAPVVRPFGADLDHVAEGPRDEIVLPLIIPVLPGVGLDDAGDSLRDGGFFCNDGYHILKS